MIDVPRLEAGLPVEGLGEPLYVFPTIGSTNDEAKSLAEHGAPHGTLVVADEQSRGRGRRERKWYSQPGSAIALSLLLRPRLVGSNESSLTALGALSVVKSLAMRKLEAYIKWPNDVIVTAGKLAGILVETSWQGDQIDYAIVGIGVNVHQGSIPQAALDFPATCVDDALGSQVDREALLLDIIANLGAWYQALGSEEMIEAWQQRLAYRDRQVQITGAGTKTVGRLEGLAEDGRLVIQVDSGEKILVAQGDLSLRPIDSDGD